MTTLREAMKQALDALECAKEETNSEEMRYAYGVTIAALRAALAEQPADWHHLTQYGYAPGHYMNQCRQCSLVKDGLDKRCYICRECAEIRHIQATTKILPLAEQPAAPVAEPTPEQIQGWAREAGMFGFEDRHTKPIERLVRAVLAAAIPQGYCVVKDEPVAAVLPGALKRYPHDKDPEHWCHEALLYSPNNPSDGAERRVKLYAARPGEPR